MKKSNKHTNGGDFTGMKVLNIGCGGRKIVGAVNLDAYSICKPDVVWDLNKTPLPFKDETFDLIMASHIFEHVPNWWNCFCDCGRILKNGGRIEVWVPGSGDAVMGYRDHVCEINLNSFYGTFTFRRPGTNAWAATERGQSNSHAIRLQFEKNVHIMSDSIIARMPSFVQNWAVQHLRNVVHENGFVFKKLSVPEFTVLNRKFMELWREDARKYEEKRAY